MDKNQTELLNKIQTFQRPYSLPLSLFGHVLVILLVHLYTIYFALFIHRYGITRLSFACLEATVEFEDPLAFLVRRYLTVLIIIHGFPSRTTRKGRSC